MDMDRTKNLWTAKMYNTVDDHLSKNKVRILPHPPYSQDLAPCDFFMFPKIKKELGGKVLIV
jgi:hypothetical protein